jgi:sulfur carrier protein
MKIQVNGDTITVPAGATIVALIEQMALAGKRLAVEVNEDIVPRSQHSEFTLSEGDTVEVVHAIGGG